MLSIKTEYNVAREYFNQFIGLLKETNPTDNLIPTDLYRTKKLVFKLNLTYTKIDCCVNGCMLYTLKKISKRLHAVIIIHQDLNQNLEIEGSRRMCLLVRCSTF
ncbi:hypothetical protein MA16_Dca020711 [Dendrobium catenatum]|uniref:Uncharacterized protein n=1 Tax=Dendrobium catenatum TaxID=906689 RepID=A0A2I0WH08_9ASPA|nr:hypothetical protein MA16_Dca020711 [Dendrobium catenatum]